MTMQRGDPILAGDNGRCATYTIAANDASNHVKAQADYVCDGTNDDAEIQAAIDALPSSGGKILLSAGTFAIGTSLSIERSDVIIEGQGQGTVLDVTALGAWEAGVAVAGSITETSATLASDASSGDITVTVSTGQGSNFSAGDWVRIRSEAVFNGGSQKYGEIRRVASVSGDDITLTEPITFDYATADTATIDLLAMRTGLKFSSFKVLGEGSSTQCGLEFMQCADVVVTAITTEDCDWVGVRFVDCVNTYVCESSIYCCNKAEYGYGVEASNASRDVVVTGNHFSDCRHAFANGGDNTYGIQHGLVFSENNVQHNSQAIGAVGAHNTVDGMVIANNTILFDGIGYFYGQRILVSGNYNYTTEYDGITVRKVSELSVVDNVIVAKGQYCIDFNSENAQDASDIVIQNNILLSDSYPIYARYGPDNLVISNNHIASTGMGEETGVYLKFDYIPDGETASHIVIDSNFIDAPISVAVVPDGLDTKTVTVNDVRICNNTCIGMSSYYGIYVWAIKGATLNRLQMCGNRLSGGGSVASLYLKGAVNDAGIHNNYVNNSGSGDAIKVASYSPDGTGRYITNNHIIAGGIVDNVGSAIIRDNIGYVTENYGSETFSGNDSDVDFTFAHGLASAPTHVEISPTTDDAAGDWKWSADATNITITYMTAPASGTDNVKFSWRAYA